MIKPDADDLLAGIIAAVEADVLPALDEGGPRRQLRSALHTLSRLQRSWGRRDAYLLADAEDIDATLDAVLRSLAEAGDPVAGGLRTGIPEADGPLPVVAREAELEALLERLDGHVRFEAEVDDERREEALGALLDLYRRMIDRQDAAWGTAPAESA